MWYINMYLRSINVVDDPHNHFHDAQSSHRYGILETEIKGVNIR